MEDRADIELLSEHNIGATQIREILGSKAGGKVNLCYSKKDVSNQIISGKRNLVGVDVNAMVDYFMRKQQEDVNAKKMQTCSYCHKKEGHNMRACPKKNKDRAQDSKAHEHEEDSDDNFQNSSEYEIDEDNLF